MFTNFLYNPRNTFENAHSATLCLHKGRIFCTWYIYEEKEHINGKIVISEYNSRRSSWGEAKVLTDFHGNYGNPVLCSHNNELILFYVKISHYWDDAKIYCMKGEDLDTGKWSAPKAINTPPGMMIRHRPLKVGRQLLMPAYDEKTMTTIIYSISDDSCEWEKYSDLDGHYIQGDLIQINDKEIEIILRAAKDNTKVFRAVSPNNGKSWNKAIETQLPCPLSGVAAIKFEDGPTLVSYNHTLKHKRSPISLNVSYNAGVNFFEKPLDIEESDTELSYPNMLIDEHKNIHMVYTFSRKKIKHIVTTLDEVEKLIKEKNA